ncbi:MAG: hypothetical protein N3G78_02660 [Desulfobacterota bacterium]|nr:hypothetical protein [Thermodesulfobacteriota bacterium]
MIILSHHTGQPYGLLGPQLAATYFQKKLSIESIVVGLGRSFSKEGLFRFLSDHYRGREKIIAFSHLCGRKDLIALMKDLKRLGFLILLAGPQAPEDYLGEPDSDLHPGRFKGLHSLVDLCYHGPVEGFPAELFRSGRGIFKAPWTPSLFLEVDWSNLFTFSADLKEHPVQIGQVLQGIGCPYGQKVQRLLLPPPVEIRDRFREPIEVTSRGCTFCDVARDKGFQGTLALNQVIHQIQGLPEKGGRKIPFELIDEYPLRSLGLLLKEAARQSLALSQIHLVCRVDDINAHAEDLPGLLQLAQEGDVKLLFASIGFESFSDRLLRYFGKGITFSDIVKGVQTLRRLKDRFPDHLLYRRDEGANHGFIRPTPWDEGEILQEIDRNIFLHRFYEDILPDHSTPLIIHHASSLGDWIREIEKRTDIRFSREGTWIEWWNPTPLLDSSRSREELSAIDPP